MASYARPKIARPDSSVSSLPAVYRQTIDEIMDVFDVRGGHVSMQADTTLWSVLLQCFARLSVAFNRSDVQDTLSTPAALSRVLHAIFDADAHAFLSHDSSGILSYLDDSTKVRMLAQAITGMVIIFLRLASRKNVTSNLFDEELRRFVESTQRSNAIRKIEASKIFGRCYMRSQILYLIMQAVDGKDDDLSRALIPDEEEYQSVISWATELPPRNMGLPWGFSIMALN